MCQRDYHKMFSFFVVTIVCVIACNASPAIPTQGNFNRYYIHTRNLRTPLIIDNSGITEAVAVLSKDRNTAVVVHGHNGSGTTSLNPTLVMALLTSADIDIIVVDWSVFASQPYANAVLSVPSVGIYLANLISELVLREVVSLGTLHLIGFDLGAHVAGFTGRALNRNVARITGLSPSRNQWGSNSLRLSSTDAQYVEVIHTDTSGLFSSGIGEAIGRVDFFVNGGTAQPGCFFNNACNHNRAWEVMAASLGHELNGNLCSNMLQVTLNSCRGFQLPMGNNDFFKFGSGIFRVNTRATYPF